MEYQLTWITYETEINQLITNGPPTWFTFGSKASVTKTAPVLYVCPYPSTKGAHIAIFMKLWTYESIGAPPPNINLHLPPNACFVLLKNILS